MQAGITKIKYNNAGQLDHNAGRFEIGIDLKLVYNNDNASLLFYIQYNFSVRFFDFINRPFSFTLIF